MTVLIITTMMIWMTDSFPSVYGFVGPDDYELYHGLHGSDGCVIYCVARGIVDADVSHWSENRGSDVSQWSDNVRHYLQKGDVILSCTGSDVSPAALEDSVVGPGGSHLALFREIVACFLPM